MKILRRLAISCAALAVASCAPVQPKLQQIPIPPERISQKGFSLLPLNEQGWLIAARNPRLLSLGKLGKSPEENVVIRAVLFQMPAFKSNDELVRLVRDGGASGINPERLKVVKHEVASHPKNGADCARSHSVLEDHGAAKMVGKEGVMVQETVTLTCAHPKDAAVGVAVSYSQRYYPGERDPRLLRKARRVLDSVEFAEL
ncbi:MAG: hypothetical protein HY661_15740 [Betaproteobacteria bacterium]|nr:hypothetical protein [Betaproteobacteria bacterium]